MRREPVLIEQEWIWQSKLVAHIFINILDKKINLGSWNIYFSLKSQCLDKKVQRSHDRVSDSQTKNTRWISWSCREKSYYRFEHFSLLIELTLLNCGSNMVSFKFFTWWSYSSDFNCDCLTWLYSHGNQTRWWGEFDSWIWIEIKISTAYKLCCNWLFNDYVRQLTTW